MATLVPDSSGSKHSSRIAAPGVTPAFHRGPKDISRLAILIALVFTVAVFYFARVVLIPLTLAVLLSLVLAPLVHRFVKLGLGRIVSVLLATALALLVIAALGWAMVNQALELTGSLPQYRDNIRQKISSVQSQSGGALGRGINTLRQIGEEMLGADTQPASAQEPTEPASAPGAPAPVFKPGPHPVRVEIVEKPGNALQSIAGRSLSLINPLLSGGIVIVFVILILIHREDLRDRVLYLIGTGQLTATTQAIDEGASRISRYLRMLLIVNGTYGVGVGIGLFAIGVPNAMLFGVTAGLVRFIPYAGPWIGAVLPIAISLAVFDSWTSPMITIGLFVVLELISNNVVEPWLYGSRTGISAVAVVASAVFWGWLWGPIGLIMAQPLTVCLVVMGRYVPHLEFLSVLLGDRPSLPSEARVYQRLLAMDYDEVFQFTQEYLQDKPLIDLYENVLMPALAMAEHDRHAGRLQEGQDQFIYQSMRDLIEELGDLQRSAVVAEAKSEARAEARAEARDSAGSAGPSAGGAVAPAPVVPTPPLGSEPGVVLCIPARDEPDALSALMLVQLLEFQGISAKATSVGTLASEVVADMEALLPRSVCVCAMPPTATSHARYVCKRILAPFRDIKVIVGIWNTPDLDRARDRIRPCGTDRVVATFAHAIELLRS